MSGDWASLYINIYFDISNNITFINFFFSCVPITTYTNNRVPDNPLISIPQL